MPVPALRNSPAPSIWAEIVVVVRSPEVSRVCVVSWIVNGPASSNELVSVSVLLRLIDSVPAGSPRFSRAPAMRALPSIAVPPVWLLFPVSVAVPPPVIWRPPISTDVVGDLIGVAAVEDQRTAVDDVADNAAGRSAIADPQDAAADRRATGVIAVAGQC